MPSPQEIEAAALRARLAELESQPTAPQDHRPKRVTSVSDWKKSSADTELELPSGNVCRVRRPGLPKLLSEGVLPDMLMPLAENAIKTGESGVAPTDAEAQKMIAEAFQGKEGAMEATFDAAARITAACVLEPAVAYHRRLRENGDGDPNKPEWEDIPEDKRDPNVLYTDEVDFMDQMYIFQYVVGGSKDLEQFRLLTS
jgi:hypothetical protein